MNPYEELGLAKDATLEEIKTRFRQLAQIYHPDKGGAEEVFIRIKLSYEILIDPLRRRNYDETGNTNQPFDTVKADATTEIANMVLALLSQINPEADDLIVIMRRELVNRKNTLIEEQQNCHRHIAHLKKFEERIRIKTDGENVIAGFVTTQIARVNEDLARMKHRNEVIDAAQKILADYNYSFDLLASIK